MPHPVERRARLMPAELPSVPNPCLVRPPWYCTPESALVRRLRAIRRDCLSLPMTRPPVRLLRASRPACLSDRSTGNGPSDRGARTPLRATRPRFDARLPRTCSPHRSARPLRVTAPSALGPVRSPPLAASAHRHAPCVLSAPVRTAGKEDPVELGISHRFVTGRSRYRIGGRSCTAALEIPPLLPSRRVSSVRG